MSKEQRTAPAIAFEKDGPIKATDLERFINSRGESIATKKAIYLCRCGASKRQAILRWHSCRRRLHRRKER